MSRQQRFGLIALAVAVAVAAFIIAQPGDDDDEQAATTGTVTTVVGADSDGDAGERTQPAETQTEEEPAEPDATRIEVEGGQPVGGVEEINVESGETVRLVVSSDTPQQVHIHGYDLIEDAAPGSPARFEFEADAEGVFEVELEGPHTLIAELRVEP